MFGRWKFFKKLVLFTAVLTGLLLIARDVFRHDDPYRSDERTIVRHFTFACESDLEGWKALDIGEVSTRYEITAGEHGPSLRAVAESSSSALYYREDIEMARSPFISWEWKVDEFPRKAYRETLLEADEFDFAAHVYVVFDAFFFFNAKAIQYVWAEDLPEGTVADNPHTPNIRTVVLRSGGSDGWYREERDIRTDHIALFGKEPARDVQAVAVMADADSTRSAAVSFFRDMKFGYTVSPPRGSYSFRRRDPREVRIKTEREPRRRPGPIF